jgi:EAL domain-containing protein (putative c-di-GMP-specific phosphodiesterase class I)
MPLQQLVNHFNDRFAHEHHAGFRPFVVENNLVSGLFGPIRISSTFSPVRRANDNDAVAGHIAQLAVSTHEHHTPGGQDGGLGDFLTDTLTQPVDFQAIINLDRLYRTVHMLNYLPYAHLGGVLFLDVDPRHILSVKQNHGVYFEEIIIKCGLATKNVAISMTVNSFYALHHGELLEGLHNYRQRGYQIALNIGPLYSANGLQDLIAKLAPDYLRANAPSAGDNGLSADISRPSALTSLKELQALVGGQTILQRVEQKEQALTPPSGGFDLVQGGYYDKVSVDHLRCL